jgi:hypothetical protein
MKMNSNISFNINLNCNDLDEYMKKNDYPTKIVLQDFVDDGLTKMQLIEEEVKYSRGFEVAKTKLEEQLSRSEMGEQEYEEKLAIAYRLFENYDEIRQLRIDKLNNLISWKEMEEKINNILHIEYNM